MKIKRKTMNKIHNEMVRRFTPYWDRKSQDIRQLQNTVIELQNAVKALQGERVQMAVQEASAGDTGKHVAKPEATEIPKRLAVWEARFNIYGGVSTRTIHVNAARALKRLGVEFVAVGSTQSPQHIRVQLFPTMFPGKIQALEEQLRRLMDAPVRVHWRKVA